MRNGISDLSARHGLRHIDLGPFSRAIRATFIHHSVGGRPALRVLIAADRPEVSSPNIGIEQRCVRPIKYRRRHRLPGKPRFQKNVSGTVRSIERTAIQQSLWLAARTGSIASGNNDRSHWRAAIYIFPAAPDSIARLDNLPLVHSHLPLVNY